MEPILLHFNQADYDAKKRALSNVRSDAQKLIDQINAINSYRVDAAGLQDLLYGRGEQVADRIEQAIKGELSRAGIQSESLIKGAIKGDLEKFYGIFKAYRQPVDESGRYLRINDEGTVVISADADSIIREEFSHYIRTEAGSSLREAHQAALDALNKVLTLSPQLTLNDLFFKGYQETSFGLTRLDYDRLSSK
ncbi:hypothetical protein FAES_0361 [Fibrella aestuarina BUZ 2]|uniref:Uncharacterized protein n=1 Tax=Fibrella aestuarina BUZ 2 TaxID=1166018 RepID=I0K2M1_9BACT|nr:hypothetical protein [Fibrella aestuarina]CCG98374.1 hypothetical protein FAES_0361 [Fibrella aestuarina BUZ 2]